MKQLMSVSALALSGVLVVASAGAFAAQVGHLPSGFQQTALVGPAPNLATLDAQRDVIAPPSSVDPGMAIDPPETGAKMPILHPRPAPGGGVIVPR
jgi:hypothetical protein